MALAGWSIRGAALVGVACLNPAMPAFADCVSECVIGWGCGPNDPNPRCRHYQDLCANYTCPEQQRPSPGRRSSTFGALAIGSTTSITEGVAFAISCDWRSQSSAQ